MNKASPFHLLFVVYFFVITTNSLPIPWLSQYSDWKTIKYQNPTTLNLNEDFHTYFYDQILDHFNYVPESYTTFKQRYIVNFKYWGGASSSSPILAYLGDEAAIDPNGVGFMTDNAASFKALLVYIEHRYYGRSVPFESMEAYKNTSTLGYFNSAQALADYAAVLIHLKDKLQAQNSPVIVVGGSYGGITDLCEAIDGAAFGSDILSRIYGAVAVFFPSRCLYFNLKNTDGWGWQTCSEMVMPIGSGNSSMFEPQPFNFKSFAAQCKKDFGVSPRPHWITTYYGGHNIKLALQKFASNIIFSNGLRDPWSNGGVLYNLSDTLVALPTVNGTHVLDIMSANEFDPEWLVDQRKKEVDIIQGWIKQYFADLDALNGTKI